MDDCTYKLLGCFTERTSVSVLELAKIINVNYLELTSGIKKLYENGYIELLPDPLNTGASIPTNKGDIPVSAQLIITYEGKIAFNNYKKDEDKFRKTELRSNIAIGISVISILISIASIVCQFLIH